jgi:arylsulfatase A-like enzyme
VGLIQDLLTQFGIADNTLLIFAADNGHCLYYGEERTGYGAYKTTDVRTVDHNKVSYTSENCGDVFDGNTSLTGCKLSSQEGGVRVPLLARWPGHIKKGAKTETMVANFDLMATMADLLGTDAGRNKDSLSYLPVLLGQDHFKGHDYLVYAGENGPALLTKEGWKLRCYIHKDYAYGTFGGTWKSVKEQLTFTLHNIFEDEREEHDLIKEKPDLARSLKMLLLKECDGNVVHGTTQPHFAFFGYDHETI